MDKPQLILQTLATHGELSTFEIIELAAGKLKRGSTGHYLELLECQHTVTSKRKEDPDLIGYDRKYYTITEVGLELLTADPIMKNLYKIKASVPLPYLVFKVDYPTILATCGRIDLRLTNKKECDVLNASLWPTPGPDTKPSDPLPRIRYANMHHISQASNDQIRSWLVQFINEKPNE